MQNTAKQNCPGLVASYDTRPGNKVSITLPSLQGAANLSEVSNYWDNHLDSLQVVIVETGVENQQEHGRVILSSLHHSHTNSPSVHH